MAEQKRLKKVYTESDTKSNNPNFEILCYSFTHMHKIGSDNAQTKFKLPSFVDYSVSPNKEYIAGIFEEDVYYDPNDSCPLYIYSLRSGKLLCEKQSRDRILCWSPCSTKLLLVKELDIDQSLIYSQKLEDRKHTNKVGKIGKDDSVRVKLDISMSSIFGATWVGNDVFISTSFNQARKYEMYHVRIDKKGKASPILSTILDKDLGEYERYSLDISAKGDYASITEGQTLRLNGQIVDHLDEPSNRLTFSPKGTYFSFRSSLGTKIYIRDRKNKEIDTIYLRDWSSVYEWDESETRLLIADKGDICTHFYIYDLKTRTQYFAGRVNDVVEWFSFASLKKEICKMLLAVESAVTSD